MKALLNALQSFALLTAAAVVLLAAGCATIDGRDAELAGKVAAARTRAEHLQVASRYEERAAEERAASARHAAQGAQERRTTELLNQGRPTRWAPSTMRAHCEGLESMHARGAMENAAEAERHRRMASEAAM